MVTMQIAPRTSGSRRLLPRKGSRIRRRKVLTPNPCPYTESTSVHRARPWEEHLRLTWIGHAGVLSLTFCTKTLPEHRRARLALTCSPHSCGHGPRRRQTRRGPWGLRCGRPGASGSSRRPDAGLALTLTPRGSQARGRGSWRGHKSWRRNTAGEDGLGRPPRTRTRSPARGRSSPPGAAGRPEGPRFLPAAPAAPRPPLHPRPQQRPPPPVPGSPEAPRPVRVPGPVKPRSPTRGPRSQSPGDRPTSLQSGHSEGAPGSGRRTALQAAPCVRAVPAPRARPERGPRAGAPTRAGRGAPRPGHKAAPREPASPAARGAARLREPSDPFRARASQPRPPGAARRRRRRHFLPLAGAASPLSGYSIHLGPLPPAPRRASASTPPAGACGDCAAPGSPAARARPAATAHGPLENPTGAHAAPAAAPRRSPRRLRASL